MIPPCAGTSLKSTYMSGPLRSTTTTLVCPNFSRAPLLFVTNSQYQPVCRAPISRVRQSDSTACHINCRRQRNLQAVQCGMLHKGGRMHLHTHLLAPRLPGLAPSQSVCQTSLKLQRALTPLQHSQFERELVNHPRVELHLVTMAHMGICINQLFK